MVVKEEGAGALLTGLGPTISGYFLQGAFKFGGEFQCVLLTPPPQGYEYWKKTIIEQVGADAATNNRTAIYLASSAIAEFFADIALCPLEATRIRLVSQPGFATGLISGMAKIAKDEGIVRGFYSGFGPSLQQLFPSPAHFSSSQTNSLHDDEVCRVRSCVGEDLRLHLDAKGKTQRVHEHCD